MNLLIHDLDEKEWTRVREDYAGWDVVKDNGAMRPCVGCFGCWNRDPGRCVVRDGYEDMGARIHRADEVVVISRYTYGGFSGSVKNVFDRSLGYVLPQFEIVGGESHHKRRYDEDKPFTFIFRGHELTDEEKDSARRYVTAVCANIRGHVKEVIFREDGGPAEAAARPASGRGERVVLLNGSMRNVKGNSAKLARWLQSTLAREAEIIDLRDYLDDMEGLVRELGDAGTIVLCLPLYVDGLPSQVIRLLETFRQSYEGSLKRIYVLANMGLYESRQLVNLFDAVRRWCGAMGFAYGGGLGVSAGELIGALTGTRPSRFGVSRHLTEGIKRLALAMELDVRMEDVYVQPFGFPRSLFLYVANTNWDRTARKNGLEPEDLYCQL